MLEGHIESYVSSTCSTCLPHVSKLGGTSYTTAVLLTGLPGPIRSSAMFDMLDIAMKGSFGVSLELNSDDVAR